MQGDNPLAPCGRKLGGAQEGHGAAAGVLTERSMGGGNSLSALALPITRC